MVSVRESVGGLPPLSRLNLPRSLHDVRSGLARFGGALLSRMLAHVVRCRPQWVR